jgi:hypothetical protein
MTIVVLDAARLHRLRTPATCRDPMREAFLSLARDEVHQPLRMVVRPPEAAGMMAVIPSYRGGADPLYGLEAVCVFHDNPTIGKDARELAAGTDGRVTVRSSSSAEDSGQASSGVYLSDLPAGSQVPAVNARNQVRAVTVGRVKIERRPLVLIEAEIDGRAVNTFIPDDWQARMMGAQGEIRPSSEIQIGDKLLGCPDAPGRHVGIRIDETIEER